MLKIPLNLHLQLIRFINDGAVTTWWIHNGLKKKKFKKHENHSSPVDTFALAMSGSGKRQRRSGRDAHL